MDKDMPRAPRVLFALLAAAALGFASGTPAFSGETDPTDESGSTAGTEETPEHPENTGKYVSGAAHALSELDPSERPDAARTLRDVALDNLPEVALERPERPEHPEHPERPEHPETPERPDHP